MALTTLFITEAQSLVLLFEQNPMGAGLFILLFTVWLTCRR